MHPGSLAFRTKSPPLTHHDAVERILRFQDQHEASEKWVAEVDIRGFFDVVSHTVARRAVSRPSRSTAGGRATGLSRAAILEAYLDSYAFNTSGHDRAFEQARRQQRPGHDVDVPWPEVNCRLLALTPSVSASVFHRVARCRAFLRTPSSTMRTGLFRQLVKQTKQRRRPSCIFATAMTSFVLPPVAEPCQRMIDAYTAALQNLQLPAHKLLVFDRPYDRARERTEGWLLERKEQGSVSLVRSGPPGSVPWCAFVGYHVRFDGKLRVRPSSIRKEIEKHNHVVSQVKHFIRRHGQTQSKTTDRVSGASTTPSDCCGNRFGWQWRSRRHRSRGRKDFDLWANIRR